MYPDVFPEAPDQAGKGKTAVAPAAAVLGNEAYLPGALAYKEPGLPFYHAGGHRPEIPRMDGMVQ